MEGLHKRLGPIGDGRLGSRPVGGGEAAGGLCWMLAMGVQYHWWLGRTDVGVLVTAAVAQELCILGYQNGARIVVEKGAAGPRRVGGRAGELLSNGSSDTGHCDVSRCKGPRSRGLGQRLMMMGVRLGTDDRLYVVGRKRRGGMRRGTE